VIAIDTNLLVYAHRPEMPFHDRARQVLSEAVAASKSVCVPWPCAHEFLAVMCNPRIFRDPTPIRRVRRHPPPPEERPPVRRGDQRLGAGQGHPRRAAPHADGLLNPANSRLCRLGPGAPASRRLLSERPAGRRRSQPSRCGPLHRRRPHLPTPNVAQIPISLPRSARSFSRCRTRRS